MVHPPKELELKEDEMICDKCNGTGYHNDHAMNNFSFIDPVCQKCQGSGKVDWISNITGEKPKLFNTNYTISCDPENTFQINGNVMINGSSIQDHIHNEVSKQLAEMIDKELVDAFRTSLEQKQKKSLWRKIFDNRIISKFMLLNNSK